MRCIKCGKGRKTKKGLCKKCRDNSENNTIENYSEHFDIDSSTDSDALATNGTEPRSGEASNGKSGTGN